MLFGMWSPHKVKLAVSGCPRNCAEAGIKDIGVIGVDSGYELYVAGNGGIKTEVAQFLCKVKSDEEVMEYSAPSCSSTARKASTWNAPVITWRASGSIT
jgi:nitrite reductase (NADH) large subunit